MKRIFDPSFRYVPSHATDVRKTFKRIRRERAAARRKQEQTVFQLARNKKPA